jgi:hypothetical protein
MKRFFISVLVAAASAASANAQYSGLPRNTEPAYWISGGVGAFNTQAVHDGGSNSTWDFGQKTSWQYRATLEKAIQNQSTIGLIATYVNVPFRYIDDLVYAAVTCAPPGCTQPPNRCSGCAAHLDMMSLAAQFHAGGGVGFHQVLEISLGATAYRNLKRDSDGMALDPTGGNVDGSFAIGYGFGYGLSSNSEVTLTQDYNIILHENSGLPSGTSNTNTARVIRMSFRYGFGTKSPTIRRRR